MKNIKIWFGAAIIVLIYLLYNIQNHIQNLEGIIYPNYCARPRSDIFRNATIGETCQIPELDPFNPEVMEGFKPGYPIRCKTKKRATLKGGVLRITGSDVISAFYRSITRPLGDDFNYNLSEAINVNNLAASIVKADFIVLTLILNNGEILTEHLMQVVKRPEILSRRISNTAMNLSFLIVGIETVSNAHAQRSLPKSINYITNVLGGYMFSGQSALNDGTTPHLVALLAGRNTQEYEESIRGNPNAKQIDDWDWIFKKAKEHGYVTSYSEDGVFFASFQNRLMGFKDPPTDYYTRPFLLKAEEDIVNSNPHCIGSEIIYQYPLNLVKSIYKEYPHRPKFIFSFIEEIYRNLSRMDNGFLRFLKHFNNKGYLENTVMIVLGDHGPRNGKIRQTMQGKLEERLPLLTMTFPKSFKRLYPDLAKNLATNTKRLTTMFDVYATLNHLFDYPNKPDYIKHGMSLLDEVPADRSCHDAEIPDHWCPCIQWAAVDTSHSHVKRAAYAAVNYMNNLNDKLDIKYCQELQLDKLQLARIKIPTKKLIKMRRSAEAQGSVVQSVDSKSLWNNECLYQLTFVTTPNQGLFEASIRYMHGKFSVSGSISRINRFDNQPFCIEKAYPILRKYCLCKEEV